MAQQEITVRKQTEEALRDTERRLYDIIDFLPDAASVIDGGGKVIEWSKSIEEMTGIHAGDMLGKGDCEYNLPFYDLFLPGVLRISAVVIVIAAQTVHHKSIERLQK